MLNRVPAKLGSVDTTLNISVSVGTAIVGESMRAVKLSDGKEVEFWSVSRTEAQPEWIKHQFYTGEMGWIDEQSLRWGFAFMRGGLRLKLGDLLSFDGKSIKLLSKEKFEKHYQIIP